MDIIENSDLRKNLEYILNSYNNLKNPELEIRIKELPFNLFQEFYKKIAQHYKHQGIECSINVLNVPVKGSKEPTKVKRLLFDGSKKVSEDYYSKNRIKSINGEISKIKYTVNLSSENPLGGTFISDNTSKVRIKVRSSFIYDNWRIDFTRVREGILDNIGKILKSLVEKLFIVKSTDEFLEQSPLEYTKFELEMEYVGDGSPSVDDIKDITSKVFSNIREDYSQTALLYEELLVISSRLSQRKHIDKNRLSLKSISNQAISLTKTEYKNIFPPIGYMVTEKTDGVRCMIRANGKICRIITKKIDEIESKDKIAVGETIVDAELVSAGNAQTIYIFDVIYLNGKSYDKVGLRERAAVLPGAAELLSKMFGLNAIAKDYKYISNADNVETVMKSVYKVDNTIDGIIIASSNDSYGDTINYKWKPQEANTVDFLAVLAPDNMIGVNPFIPLENHTIYFLYVGIRYEDKKALGLNFLPNHKQILSKFSHLNDKKYFPIQFSSAGNPNSFIWQCKEKIPLDGKIVELRGVPADDYTLCTKWELVRVREDKAINEYNNYKTAESIYTGCINPFPFEELYAPKFGYFTFTKSDAYRAGTAYRRYVIGLLINKYCKSADLVVDLASGRGAEIDRYRAANVNRVLFTDNDHDALAELLTRRFSKKNARKPVNQKVGGFLTSREAHMSDAEIRESTTIYVLPVDLKNKHTAVMAAITSRFPIDAKSASAVVCNFAFHYFCDTIEHMRELLKLAYNLLKPKGTFIFTVLDGSAVFKELANLKTGETWELREETANSLPKHQIIKNYTSTKLEDAGQMIKIKLPFTDTLYEEPLCNITAVIREAEKIGFKREVDSNFSDYLDEFMINSKYKNKNLTSVDKKYISMHSYVILRT